MKDLKDISSTFSADQDPDLVLIDNDSLVIKTWEFSAKQQGKNILVFDNFKEANKNIDHLPRTIPIYIDSDLEADMRGEECAKILYEKGFVNLYLETGHSASHFKLMHWIKGIVGKDPRF